MSKNANIGLEGTLQILFCLRKSLTELEKDEVYTCYGH